MTDPTTQPDDEETFALRAFDDVAIDCTLIPNAFIHNGSLSPEARGLGYWFATLANADFTATLDQATAAGPELPDAVRVIVDELAAAGYLTPAGDGYRFAFKPEEIEAAGPLPDGYSMPGQTEATR